MLVNRRRGVRFFPVVATVASLAVAAVTVPASAAPASHNAAPRVSVKISTTSDANGTLRGVVKATDVDSKDLRIHVPKRTDKGHVTWKLAKTGAATGAFTYTPTASARHQAASDSATAQDATDSFTVTVTDGEGGRTTVPVAVAISPFNTAPTYATTVGVPNPATGVVTGTVGGFDADGDPLTYSTPADTTSKGTVTVDSTDGAFTYTPTATARLAAGQPGATQTDKTDTFTVTVADGYGGTVAVPVSVTVAPLAG